MTSKLFPTRTLFLFVVVCISVKTTFGQNQVKAMQLAFGQTELKSDFDKAVKLLQSDNYKKAVDAFSNVLTKATDDKLRKYCFIYRAFSYNGLNDFKNAKTDLDKAIELDPNDLASYTDRGKTKAYANDLDGAKKGFLFILTKDSTGTVIKVI